MQPKRLLVPAGFFLFLCWIIYLANTGSDSVFFDLVDRLPYGDKVGHFGLYGVLTLLLNLGLGCRSVAVGGIKLLSGSLVVLVFAVGEELTQGFLPSRTMDITDVIADLLGILAFGYLAVKLCERFSRKAPRGP